MDMSDSGSSGLPRHRRRRFLQALVATPAGVLSLGAAGFVSAARAQGGAASGAAAATMGLISTKVCSLMPETTEGPYYIDPKLVRRDMTEGRPGIPLSMQLQVVTADCRPVGGARVDIWHCDAEGNYSGFAGQGSDARLDTVGQTFMRGTQTTDGNGVVSFDTIYPGWYRGRTTHIHYKIFLDRKTVLTSQIFFPDALSEYIYEKAPAYRRSSRRDTLNRGDGIAAAVGEGAQCMIREQRDRYVAALVVGIDPDAQWSARGPGMGGRPPGPPPAGGPRAPGPGGRRDQEGRIFPGG